MGRDDIQAQLLADAHYLGSLPASDLLLHRNASVPWFILVPETRMNDFLDLPEEHRSAVLADCAAVSEFIKNVLGYPKVNFAGIGNVVPQMHLHVVGRFEEDPCWPSPVWGNLEAGENYSPETLHDWQEQLLQLTGLVPADL